VGALALSPVMRSPGAISGPGLGLTAALVSSSSVPSWTRWSPLTAGGLSVAGDEERGGQFKATTP
jgi:hypothetical protein